MPSLCGLWKLVVLDHCELMTSILNPSKTLKTLSMETVNRTRSPQPRTPSDWCHALNVLLAASSAIWLETRIYKVRAFGIPMMGEGVWRLIFGVRPGMRSSLQGLPMWTCGVWCLDAVVISPEAGEKRTPSPKLQTQKLRPWET